MSAIVAEFAQNNPEVEVEVIAYLREDELRYEDFDALIRYGAQNESDMPMRFYRSAVVLFVRQYWIFGAAPLANASQWFVGARLLGAAEPLSV